MNSRNILWGIFLLLGLCTSAAVADINIQITAQNYEPDVVNLIFENIDFEPMCAGEFDISFLEEFEVQNVEMINGAEDYMCFYNVQDASVYIAFAGVYEVPLLEPYMNLYFNLPEGHVFIFEDISFDFVILNEDPGPYHFRFAYDYDHGSYNFPGTAGIEDMGACCYPDLSCILLSLDECELTGGTFMSSGVPCDVVTCPEEPINVDNITWGKIKSLY